MMMAMMPRRRDEEGKIGQCTESRESAVSTLIVVHSYLKMVFTSKNNDVLFILALIILTVQEIFSSVIFITESAVIKFFLNRIH